MENLNSKLTYGSVCSGIEAASVAWEPLGWKPAWFAEIEPFPAAVLAQNWPQVPNLGDMTTIAARIEANEVEAPPVLVGGTPCQAFSVAGLRAGLSDERGQLTIKYVGLIDAIDRKRAEHGERPCIAVWENVPGVLTSKDNAFGAFLGLLAGESCNLEPPGGKWANVGYVSGPARTIAWRVLDAQYFRVAQRRRRVILVTSADPRINPEKILFEFDGVRRDIAPSREAQSGIAPDAGDRINNGSHWDGANYPHTTLNPYAELVGTIAAHSFTGGAGGRPEGAAEGHFSPVILACMATGQGGAEVSEDGHAPTLTCNHEAPIVVYPFAEKPLAFPGFMSGTQYASALDISPALTSSNQMAITYRLQVRRLMPVECERLQGFPDGHTCIPWRKKAVDNCPDGHRYKAIGNSMAVPVMRWIGQRISSAINTAKQTPLEPVLVKRQIRAFDELQRSIFKWVGGKHSVFPILSNHLPHGKRLIEPFVGGGVVFTNAGYSRNLLNDINPDLINFYKVLQREAHRLITLAYRYFKDYGNAEGYHEVCASFNSHQFDDLYRAAAFLYLNRHCFNGLIRYNKKGQFNVGWGKYKSPYFPHAEMEEFLGIADRSEFMCGDFASVIAAAGGDDVIYCDPPYEPLPDTNGFTSYSGHKFPFEEQKRLVSLLVAAHKRGAQVVITNSGAPNIRELYQAHGFTLHELPARRSISCKSETRMIANDIIAKLEY